MKKSLHVLAVAVPLVFGIACNDRYQEGYNAGYNGQYQTGYNAGYADGDEDGFDRGEAYFTTHNTYDQGYAVGLNDGTAIGYNQGYAAGKTDGIAIGYQQSLTDGSWTSNYNTGYNDGYNDGDEDGYDDGYDAGYNDGYEDGNYLISGAITAAYNSGYNSAYNTGFNDGDYDGYSDGLDDGYDLGYTDGFDDGEAFGYDIGFGDGYDIGFDDGWDAALGLSVGAIKVAQQGGRANLLSQVHNDLVNYSKIKAPKVTARGLEVGGKLIFEENSLSSKDLSKRSAAAEQYLVQEMSKQIKAKFSLSGESSLRIAKLSNHWRKYSTTRQLTDADAEATSELMIGVNLKQVEKAVTASLKGETEQLNNIIDRAAEVNATTPEHVSSMMRQLFF